MEKVKFQLPDSISSTTFSSDSLQIFYSILGINDIQSTIVYPNLMSSADYSKLTPTQQNPNFLEFGAIEYDGQSNTIKFLRSGVEIDRDLIIPEGHTLTAEPGTKINLTNAARIISYSPISFIGEPNNEIILTSTDSTGQGIVVYSASSASKLSYVNFDKLSNIADNAWILRGVITFYESPVEIDNCVFTNNLSGDDYLNVIRTRFNITNTLFENTNADALDSDFCIGTLSNTRFINIGNDALDISGTKLEIAEVEIYKPADKGISAGERSDLKCRSISITGGEIAVAGKDDSIIEIEDITVNSSALAYCAFQKKPEYGEGRIKVVNSKVVNVKTEHLIEVGSWLSIDGKMIKGDKEGVNDMLYGAQYGKSSK